MQIRHQGQQMKHWVSVRRKRARFTAIRWKFDAATALFRYVEEVAPYVYRPRRYAGSFLSSDVPPVGTSALPRQVFVIWSGENELSANRSRNLELIRARLELPVELVTPHNVDGWIVDGHPLHPSYRHLSLIHRSDYLRGYLMHHHGGAYVDIKEPRESWARSFDEMAADPDAWVTSYTTTEANWIGKLRGRLGLDILVRYRMMFGKCSFIMRSHTPLTAAWMKQMDALLDENQDRLAEHPGGVYGEDPLYPLKWTDLLSRVLDPLTLKYYQHVRRDDRMLLSFDGYR